jgi:hypothetical protein
MLDIFRNDAFGVVPLSLAINNLKFVPGYFGKQGVFSERPVWATAVVIEERNFVLTLVPPSARGGPGTAVTKPARTMRMLRVPHFEINDSIMAEEVQGVRPFGQETGTEAVMTKVAERMQMAGQSFEYTLEYARVGAIQGIVTYADGSTLNLFNEYGITPPTPFNFVLSAASSTGQVRQVCAAVIRKIGTALDGVPFVGVNAVCGDAFFDALITSAEVRATYLATMDALELRKGYVDGGLVWGSFAFGGIDWVNYRGYVGGTPMIPVDSAFFYPTGVQQLFPTFFAPADYIETVNTMGLPRYVKQYPMPNDKGIHIDTQMNALNICSRPLCLQQGTHS